MCNCWEEGMKVQVEPDHYFDESYDSKERFITYWYQTREIVELNLWGQNEVGFLAH